MGLPILSSIPPILADLPKPLDRQQYPRRSLAFDLALILATTIGLFFRYLLATTLPGGGEPFAAINVQSAVQYSAQEIAAGRIPLWNPYAYGGYPHLALAYPGVFYFPNIVYAIGTSAALVRLDIAIHVFAFTTFAYLLGRDVFHRRVTALFFAVSILCSVSLVETAFGGHVSEIHGVTYLPLVFLVARRILIGGGTGWVLTLPVLLAIQCFSGAILTLLFQGMAIAVFTVVYLSGRFLVDREPLRNALLPTALLGSASLVGIGIASIQLFPSFELLLTQSTRSSEHVSGLLQLDDPFLRPFMESLHWTGPSSTPAEEPYVAPPFALGLFTLSLMTFGILRGNPRAKWPLLWSALILCVYGLHAFALLYDRYLYKVALQSVSSGVQVLAISVTFFCGLLASMAVNALLDDSRGAALNKKDGALLLLMLVPALAWMIYNTPEASRLTSITDCVLALFFLVLLFIRSKRELYFSTWIAVCVVSQGVQAQAAVSARTDEGTGFVASEAFAEIADQHKEVERMVLVAGSGDDAWHLHPRLGALNGERTIVFAEATRFTDFGGYWEAALHDYDSPTTIWTVANQTQGVYKRGSLPPGAFSILEIMGAPYFVAAAPGTPFLNALADSSDSVLRYEAGNLVVYWNRNSKPPAYILHEVHHCESVDAIFDDLRTGAHKLGTTALTEVPVDDTGFGPASEGESAAITNYENETVSVSLTNLSRSGVLVLTDVFFPGWRAEVNGERSAEILRIDGLLRGVVVRPGDTDVTFSYEPASFLLGRRVTFGAALGWSICVLASIGIRARRRRFAMNPGTQK